MNKRGRPATKLDLEKVYTCVLCQKHFSNHTGFRAHHANVFEPGERCLTKLELITLGFSQAKNGVWHAGIGAVTDPSKIGPLARTKAPYFHQLQPIDSKGAKT